jgi:hypothetical protein
MPSEIIFGTLAGLFISAVYIANKLVKKGDAAPGATWMQKHVAVVGIVALLVPFVVGLVLVNTVFGKTTVVKKVKRKQRLYKRVKPHVAPPRPEPVLKLVISDGSKEADIALLNRCDYDEVTVVQNGTVRCVSHQSSQVKAWVSDLRVHEEDRLRKYIQHQTGHPERLPMRVAPMRAPPVMRQGFLWFAPTGTSEKTVTKKETKQKPFRDRHAELFYFLALVLGVLGKYFWDYYEDKRAGKPATFEPHLIVMSFIIAALVYYSIQQGIEKEASKFTTRGVVFAFNNGFMWQTILTSMNRGRNGQTASTEETAT